MAAATPFPAVCLLTLTAAHSPTQSEDDTEDDGPATGGDDGPATGGDDSSDCASSCESDTAEKSVVFPSSSLLQSDGLEVFARRSKNAAAAAESLPDVLLSHLPPDPRELAIGSRLSTGSSATISIKDLTQRHRGEVRELSSSAYWSPWEGKVPASARHPQLIGLIMQWQPASGGSEPASDSRQRQPASGGSEAAFGCSTQLYMRVAKVFSLMDLFTGLGAAFTADALYKF